MSAFHVLPRSISPFFLSKTPVQRAVKANVFMDDNLFADMTFTPNCPFHSRSDRCAIEWRVGGRKRVCGSEQCIATKYKKVRSPIKTD